MSMMLNAAWCRWLLTLDERDRRLIYANEVFYFDLFNSCRKSPPEILVDARTAWLVEEHSVRV